MSEYCADPREVSRITCHVHHHMSDAVTEELFRLGIQSILVETGRSVRLHQQSRRFGLPGSRVTMADSPADLFRFTIAREDVEPVTQALIQAAELYAPGRGTIYAQDVIEYCPGEISPATPTAPATARSASAAGGGGASHPVRGTVHDLAVLTCILSMPGSGEQLAREALELGTCVPVVTLGFGTGLRDLLGLLRITIPPEKDVVHLVIPAHDTKSIIRVLIEHMNLNRPGRGIIYQTPARAGMIDTRLRIGRQEHAASIEQIITAIDELKHSTAWRTRFPTLEQKQLGVTPPLFRDRYEITIVSDEGKAGRLVSRAIEAGAGGATTSRVRRVTLTEGENGIAAREYTTIVVPETIRDTVVHSLLDESFIGEADRTNRLQVLHVPAAFTHTVSK